MKRAKVYHVLPAYVDPETYYRANSGYFLFPGLYASHSVYIGVDGNLVERSDWQLIHWSGSSVGPRLLTLCQARALAEAWEHVIDWTLPATEIVKLRGITSQLEKIRKQVLGY